MPEAMPPIKKMLQKKMAEALLCRRPAYDPGRAAAVLVLILAVLPTVSPLSSFCQDKSGNKCKESPAKQEPESGKKDQFSKPYGFYLSPMLIHIKANDEQKSKIKVIVESYRGRIEPLRNEYRQKNQELLAKLSKSETSANILNDQMQLGRLYTDINLYYCQMSLEVRKVLSAEQIVLYEEFKKQQGWGSKRSN